MFCCRFLFVAVVCLFLVFSFCFVSVSVVVALFGQVLVSIVLLSAHVNKRRYLSLFFSPREILIGFKASVSGADATCTYDIIPHRRQRGLGGRGFVSPGDSRASLQLPDPSDDPAAVLTGGGTALRWRLGSQTGVCFFVFFFFSS